MERDGKKKEDGEAREKMTETHYAVGPHWKKLKIFIREKCPWNLGR